MLLDWPQLRDSMKSTRAGWSPFETRGTAQLVLVAKEVKELKTMMPRVPIPDHYQQWKPLRGKELGEGRASPQKETQG